MSVHNCRCWNDPNPPARCSLCGAGHPAHRCHAKGCEVEVQPRLLMCLKHWNMVPHTIRYRVWNSYVGGQEIRKDPSDSYMRAQREAVAAVAEVERRLMK